MNRLKKAASLGFGPLMERGKGDEGGGPPDARRALAPPRTYRSRSRSRDRGGGGGASSGVGGEAQNSAAALAVREHQERRREALRQVLKQASDEPDIDGFLNFAKKPKPSLAVGPKLDVKVSKLDLKISTSTAARATAAASGARPKAGAKAAAKPSEPSEPPPPPELTQRQQDEKVRAEFEAMQRKAKRTVNPDAVFDDEVDKDDRYDNLDYDSEEEDSKRRKKEQKKQREEWRRQRKEELKHQSQKPKTDGSEGSEDEGGKASDDEMTKLEKEEKEAAKMRAQTWRTINNNGRYSKVKGQYVGQLSDRDLDKRIQEEKAKNAGQSLMSEAEAIAKLQKGRGGTGGTGGPGGVGRRSRSPKRT